MKGEIGIASVREVDVKSGLPATTSTERLGLLDDNELFLVSKSLVVITGSRRKHKRRDLILRGSSYTMQSQISVKCLRKNGCSRHDISYESVLSFLRQTVGSYSNNW